jgi:predicted nucleic acid-binding protein
LKLLIDTNILIDALNAKRGRVDLIESFIAQQFTLTTCAIIVAEVFTGIRPQHLKRAEILLRSLVFMETGPVAAQFAGKLRRRYRERGISLSTQDCLIASTAIVHDLTLVTDNRKDFPMPELRIYPLPS